MSDALRSRLVAELVPIKPVWSPLRQFVAWIVVFGIVALISAGFADLPVVAHKLMIVPDMWVAELGAIATAFLSAIAAILLSRPDRTPRWALLPVPALIVWISASFVGSTHIGPNEGGGGFSSMEAALYSSWICGCSVPLATATFYLLRRGYSLYPALTGTVAGLSVASASAALMVLLHPGEAPLFNLLVHGAAVLVVALIGSQLGAWVFGRRERLAVRCSPQR